MTPGYDLLASGLLLGGSSVALALTALAARRASVAARLAKFSATSAMADRKEANNRASDAGDWCEASKRHANNAMKAANAASLDHLFTTAGITVTAPETVDVIPIPVPPLKPYAEVEGVPGSVVAADDAGDDSADVIQFEKFFQEFGGEAGA